MGCYVGEGIPFVKALMAAVAACGAAGAGAARGAATKAVKSAPPKDFSCGLGLRRHLYKLLKGDYIGDDFRGYYRG